MNIYEKIRYIVIHCTAGYGNIDSIIKFWRETLGWNGNGYSIIVDLVGTRWYLTKDKTYSTDREKADFEQITNGVLGYNDISRHISYIGGVHKNNYTKSLDSRTEAQKLGIEKAIYDILAWLAFNGRSINKDLRIVGHRDFSEDENGNGIIEPWERMKECPSFDAMKEYGWILNYDDKLPNKENSHEFN